MTFDTFNAAKFTWKAEELDIDSGQFIDNPVLSTSPRPACGFQVGLVFGMAAVVGVDVVTTDTADGERWQLTLGWIMCAGDSNEKLAPNGDKISQSTSNPNDSRYQPGGAWSQWCPGLMNIAPSAFSNAWIKAGLIYPSVNSEKVYRCPADKSVFPAGASYGKPRVRSMSMNCWLNPITSWNTTEGYSGANALREFKKTADLTVPGPIMTFVFLDENPNTIDDAFFVCDPNLTDFWQNVPASYHDNAGGISFADGHAEIKRWKDSHLLTQAKLNGIVSDPGSQDLVWLQQRSTARQQ